MTATLGSTVSLVRRETRPFLYLDPKPIPAGKAEVEARDLKLLNRAVGNRAPALVRSLVNYTIELRNQQNRRAGFNQPIVLSVLNRRRRSARAWILAILAGKTDRATLHAFTRTWMPQMAGTGPDLLHGSVVIIIEDDLEPGRTFDARLLLEREPAFALALDEGVPDARILRLLRHAP